MPTIKHLLGNTLLCILLIVHTAGARSGQPPGHLQLNEKGYFAMPGLNIMVFEDIYPEGHQGGISIIQNGERIATNGDVRLSPTPGQWQPLPVMEDREMDSTENVIRVTLSYPDTSRHRQGFNPMIYPALKFQYRIRVEPLKESAFRVTVDLQNPLPEQWDGQVGFNLELFPTLLFGKSYSMDGHMGIFPRQANGPMIRDTKGNYFSKPLAEGRRLVVAPESEQRRMMIESKSGPLQLIDGRGNHNNGWFVVRSPIPSNVTDGAVEWVITPDVIPDWRYGPVVHVSQVGYHPDQEKVAVIELDSRVGKSDTVSLNRVLDSGAKVTVRSLKPEYWGKFLRYQYYTFDFSDVTTPGIYVIGYGDFITEPFLIDPEVFERHVWQPTLEYFLPVQMCHMRVNEKYRVWHDLCHMDDALMAPVNINHFDGYRQGDSTLTNYEPLEHVPGLNSGGWHDAGDYDMRIESQAGTVYMLSLTYEEFGIEYDQTTIDQRRHLVEIHRPDSIPDVLQQIEHGVLSILGGYRQLDRLYRGIICPTLRQYVMLGDAASMTDNEVYQPSERPVDFTGLWFQKVANRYSALYDPMMQYDEIGYIAENLDDRLVFTEKNPGRALETAAALAAAARVMDGYDNALAKECLSVAGELWQRYGTRDAEVANQKIRALAELILATGQPEYKQELIRMSSVVREHISESGWVLGRVLPLIDDTAFTKSVTESVEDFRMGTEHRAQQTPFGVPYEPYIWGAGWGIQEFGVEQYFLHTGWPEIFPREYMLNAMNFVLGVHPGSNTVSFVSGVGSNSLTVAYGVNRADWSFIPGGVGSGTNLVRPDFPELKTWPYLWQQTEYVVGGGGSNFMFMVLAADQLLPQ